MTEGLSMSERDTETMTTGTRVRRALIVTFVVSLGILGAEFAAAHDQ